MDCRNDLEGVRRQLAPMRYISPEQGEYFFGYYDLPAYNADGSRHLASRLPFSDRDKGPEDKVEIGFLDCDGRRFEPFAETAAWCFQQNCLLQYGWNDADLLFYNDFNAADRSYSTVKYSLQNGKVRCSSRALATVSRDGRFGLAVNFPRIWDFRPGYGYCNTRDPYSAVPVPKDDGVFLCDFDGNERLLCSYAELDERFAAEGEHGRKLVVNHVTLNPSGTRYLMLLRTFPDENHASWSTSLITGDLQGRLRPLILHTIVSHYWWQDDGRIVIYTAPKPNGTWRDLSLFTVTDSEPCRVTPVGSDLLANHSDIHCSLSPDGRYLLGDDYPNPEGYRQIRIEDLGTGRSGVLAEVYSPMPQNGDIRCDLHARFNRQGTRVSFDSVARGKREICEIDITRLSL